MAIYVMAVYQDQEIEKWLRQQYATSGMKLDMGKSCIRFKSIEQVPLDVIGELFSKVTVQEFIAGYQACRRV